LQGEITDEQIVVFQQKYSGSSVPLLVNRIENDYGPGTKLLGLFEPTMNVCIPEDACILLVDDDMIYKPVTVEAFLIYFLSNTNIQVGSFDCYHFSNFNIGQGVCGYMMKWNLMNCFSKYYSLIKDQDYVNYQDDIYISFYFHLQGVPLHYFQLKDNEPICEHSSTAELDGLHNLDNKYNRKDVDSHTLSILEQMNRDGCFTNLFIL
jgi:hypothetical protein